MEKKFKVGDHVTWNSEAGHVSGRIIKPLLKRLLAITEKTIGPDHPRVANSLTNLAELYVDQGRYADAEPLYKRSCRSTLCVEEFAYERRSGCHRGGSGTMVGAHFCQGNDRRSRADQSASDEWEDELRRAH